MSYSTRNTNILTCKIHNVKVVKFKTVYYLFTQLSTIYGWNELDLEFVIIKTSIKRLLTFIKGATKL